MSKFDDSVPDYVTATQTHKNNPYFNNAPYAEEVNNVPYYESPNVNNNNNNATSDTDGIQMVVLGNNDNNTNGPIADGFLKSNIQGPVADTDGTSTEAAKPIPINPFAPRGAVEVDNFTRNLPIYNIHHNEYIYGTVPDPDHKTCPTFCEISSSWLGCLAIGGLIGIIMLALNDILFAGAQVILLTAVSTIMYLILWCTSFCNGHCCCAATCCGIGDWEPWNVHDYTKGRLVKTDGCCIRAPYLNTIFAPSPRLHINKDIPNMAYQPQIPHGTTVNHAKLNQANDDVMNKMPPLITKVVERLEHYQRFVPELYFHIRTWDNKNVGVGSQPQWTNEYVSNFLLQIPLSTFTNVSIDPYHFLYSLNQRTKIGDVTIMGKPFLASLAPRDYLILQQIKNELTQYYSQEATYCNITLQLFARDPTIADFCLDWFSHSEYQEVMTKQQQNAQILNTIDWSTNNGEDAFQVLSQEMKANIQFAREKGAFGNNTPNSDNTTNNNNNISLLLRLMHTHNDQITTLQSSIRHDYMANLLIRPLKVYHDRQNKTADFGMSQPPQFKTPAFLFHKTNDETNMAFIGDHYACQKSYHNMVDPATPQHLKCNLHENDNITTLTWDCQDNITSGVLLHIKSPSQIDLQQYCSNFPQYADQQQQENKQGNNNNEDVYYYSANYHDVHPMFYSHKYLSLDLPFVPAKKQTPAMQQKLQSLQQQQQQNGGSQQQQPQDLADLTDYNTVPWVSPVLSGETPDSNIRYEYSSPCTRRCGLFWTYWVLFPLHWLTCSLFVMMCCFYNRGITINYPNTYNVTLCSIEEFRARHRALILLNELQQSVNITATTNNNNNQPTMSTTPYNPPVDAYNAPPAAYNPPNVESPPPAYIPPQNAEMIA